jgi:hypothetical protein
MKQLLIILCFCGCFWSAFAQKTPKRFVSIQQKIQTWVDSGNYDGASIVVFQKIKRFTKPILEIMTKIELFSLPQLANGWQQLPLEFW